MRLVVCFSGQGGQSEKHLHEVQHDPFVAGALARVLPAAGTLADNLTAQCVISALHAARWHRLAPRLGRAQLLAGYSLGELSAFAVARGLAPDDWLALAARRANLMDAAAPPGCGMLAVQGMNGTQLEAALAGQDAHIAIRNGETHWVVAARAALLDALETRLPALGARRCMRLAVHTPSHTRLLDAARAPLADALAPWADGNVPVPVLAGISGGAQRRATDIVRALADQVAQRLDWAACMDTIMEYAPDAVLEIGPCNALSRMLAEHAPDLPARSVDDFSGDDALVAWLARQAAGSR
jgi:[acyl-carrier-protein] S-malonyltransferase